MDLGKLFKKGQIGGELDLEYIQSMRDESQKQFDQLSTNWKTIQDFYDGNQWGARLGGNDVLLTKGDGTPVWGTATDLIRYGNEKKSKMPLRTVNKIKNYIEALVASFVEVNPQPHASSTSNYYGDPEIMRKADLWYDTVFNKENDFKHMYENATRKALLRTFSLYQIAIDEDHAKTEIPIKFKYVDNMDIRVDPYAPSLDEADYIIQKMSMRYRELKDSYDYTWSKLVQEEPDDFTMVTMEIFWIRFRDTKYSPLDRKKINPKWMMIPIYDGQKLNIKKNGKVADKESDYIYPVLPFVMFKTITTEYWHCGQPIVSDAIEAQIDYNKTISERDYNWNMFIDPVAVTTMDVAKIDEGNFPGGKIAKKATDVLEWKITMLADVATINNRLETVDNEIAEVFGTSKELMQGRKPTGTYSDKLMQTLIQLSQLKPKRMEGYFIDAVKQLADKAMELWCDYMGSRSIIMFDPDYAKEDDKGNIVEYGRYVKLDPTNIRSVLYKTDVEISDANLLTPEAKFKNLTDLMQYGGDALKSMTGYEYFIFLMAHQAEMGLVPDELLEPIRLMYDASVKKKMAELGITKPGMNQNTQQFNQNALQDEITNIKNEFIQSGIYDQLEQQLGKNFLENAAQENLNSGVSEEETIINLRSLGDRLKNVNNNTQGAQ